MTDDELLFFDSMPQMLPIYEAFCQGLADRGLAFTAKVSRTQISLRNRYVFAAVSLPWRKVKGWPEEYLLVSLGLALGQGQTVEQALAGKRSVAEGYESAPAVRELAARLGVEIPISEGVAALLAGEIDVDGLIDGLLSRPLKAERV